MSAAIAVLVLVVAVLSASTAAEIARERGRSIVGWAVAGFVVPFGGAVLVWLSPPNGRVWRRCAHCAEQVRPRAVVCPYCGRDVA